MCGSTDGDGPPALPGVASDIGDGGFSIGGGCLPRIEPLLPPLSGLAGVEEERDGSGDSSGGGHVGTEERFFEREPPLREKPAGGTAFAFCSSRKRSRAARSGACGVRVRGMGKLSGRGGGGRGGCACRGGRRGSPRS